MSEVQLTPVTPEEYLEPGYYLATLTVTRGNVLSLTRKHLETPLKERYGSRVDLLTYTPSQDGREVLLQLRVNPLSFDEASEVSAQAVPVPLVWLAGVCVVMLAGWGISYNFKDAFRIDSEDISKALEQISKSFRSPGGQFAAIATSTAYVVAALALLVWVWPKGKR